MPGFLDLKGLTDKTLGVFLDPYQALFGLYTNANKIKEVRVKTSSLRFFIKINFQFQNTIF